MRIHPRTNIVPLCLLLAFFAFQILPVNTTGVLLVLFGLALLILEL